MLPTGRRIGVQADAEGRGGAIARCAGAGVDQSADKPGFPAVQRAVFHPPEEAVRCKVAVEPTAHFGGIAAEGGEEVEAVLQLAVGSDGAGKFPHLIEVLLVLDDQHSIAPLAVEERRGGAALGVSGVERKNSGEPRQGSDKWFRRPALGWFGAGQASQTVIEPSRM